MRVATRRVGACAREGGSGSLASRSGGDRSRILWHGATRSMRVASALVRAAPGGMPTSSWAWIVAAAGSDPARPTPMPTKTWACYFYCHRSVEDTAVTYLIDTGCGGWPGQLVVPVAKRQEVCAGRIESGRRRPSRTSRGCATRTTSCPGHPRSICDSRMTQPRCKIAPGAPGQEARGSFFIIAAGVEIVPGIPLARRPRRPAGLRGENWGEFSPKPTGIATTPGAMQSCTRSHALRGNAVFDALRRLSARRAAERPGRHSHGDRGNEFLSASARSLELGASHAPCERRNYPQAAGRCDRRQP